MRGLLIAALIALVLPAAAQDASALLMVMGEDAAWTPADLPNLLRWWDASDNATTLDAGGSPATNGSTIATWTDKAASATATQGVDSSRPVYVTGALNSLPVLRADGSTVLNIGSFLNYTNSAVIMCGKFNVGANQYAFGMASGSQAYYMHTGASDVGLRYRDIGNQSIYAQSSTNPQGSYHVHFGICAGKSGSIAIDGGTPVVSTNPSYNDSQTFSFPGGIFAYNSGSAGSISGDIAELIILSSVPTAEEIDSINEYLKAKWGTP